MSYILFARRTLTWKLLCRTKTNHFCQQLSTVHQNRHRWCFPVRQKRRGNGWRRSETLGRAVWALKTNMICCRNYNPIRFIIGLLCIVSTLHCQCLHSAFLLCKWFTNISFNTVFVSTGVQPRLLLICVFCFIFSSVDIFCWNNLLVQFNVITVLLTTQSGFSLFCGLWEVG